MNKIKFNNLIWVLTHLIKIVNKAGQKVTLKPNHVQADFEKNKTGRDLVLKSRQHGFTTFAVLMLLVKCLLRPHMRSLILSYDRESALDIFDKKVDYALKNLPKAFTDRLNLDTERANEIKIMHKDNSFSSIEVKASGRSGTYTHVHVSELPRLEEKSKSRAMEVITGTLQAVPFNGEICIEATFRQENDIFHKMCLDAIEGKNDYKFHFYNWQWDKEQIALAPSFATLPAEILEYQKKHNLTEQETFFYYKKLRDLNMNWNEMKREYPTTYHEAFSISVVGAIFEKEIDLWYNKGAITRVPYNPEYPVYVVQDIGFTDLTVLIWVQKVAGEIRIIDYYENNHFLADHYIDIIKNRSYRCDMVFLPHDARQKKSTDGKSVENYYQKAGMRYHIMKASSEDDRIDAIVQRSHALVFDKVNANKLIAHLKKVRKKNSKDKKIVHDDESNAFDSLGYLCLIAGNIHSYNRNTGIEVIA